MVFRDKKMHTAIFLSETRSILSVQQFETPLIYHKKKGFPKWKAFLSNFLFFLGNYLPIAFCLYMS